MSNRVRYIITADSEAFRVATVLRIRESIEAALRDYHRRVADHILNDAGLNTQGTGLGEGDEDGSGSKGTAKDG